MRTNTKDKKIHFTILPYLIVSTPFRFAEFRIWRDTSENWIKYAHTSRPTSLLNIYVDRKLNKITEKTIITSTKEYDPERLKQLISILFYFPSTQHWFPARTESFHYETYFQPKDKMTDDGNHTRVDKFTMNLVASKDYKIVQPHETEIIKFELRSTEIEYFIKFRRMFNSQRNLQIFKSLNFYFRTQYKNVFLFPEIEDIQNFCTAFEIFFEISDTNDIANKISEKLFKYFKLADDCDRNKLCTWFKALYKVRSDYTHGHDITPEMLLVKNQRHIDIAKQIYSECVMKCVKPKKGVGYRIMSADNSLLVKLFSSKDVTEDLVKNLTTSWNKTKESGKNNLLYLQNCEIKQLGQIVVLCYKFILYASKKFVGEINKKRVFSAMATILAVVNDMINTYNDQKYEKEFNTEVIPNIKALPLFPKTDAELELAYNYFKSPFINYTKVIGDIDKPSEWDVKRELVYRDILEISLLAHVFTELYHVYKGWNVD